ncbi:hypothetical protein J4E91_009745 [Alternaria rosae]|nr:hypothetical protein J4E91_009745 [Alternaria rosae]
MADQGLRDFDESPDKTKQYWAQHPDLFSLYFGKYGSSSKASSSHHLRPPTQVSFDLAKDDGYGRDEGLCNSIEIGLIAAREDFKRLVKRYQTKISITDSYSYEIPIHAPRPRRKQRIAADFEDMIERAKGYDPIPFAAYEAVHDAPERMLRQPGSDPAYQHQWQQPQDASWGLHQNYPEPGFVHGGGTVNNYLRISNVGLNHYHGTRNIMRTSRCMRLSIMLGTSSSISHSSQYLVTTDISHYQDQHMRHIDARILILMLLE